MTLRAQATRIRGLGILIAALAVAIFLYALYRDSQRVLYFAPKEDELTLTLSTQRWRWVVLPKGVRRYTVTPSGAQYETRRWMRLAAEALGFAVVTLWDPQRPDAAIVERAPVRESLQDRIAYSFPEGASRIRVSITPEQEVWIQVPVGATCMVRSSVGYDRMDEVAFRGAGRITITASY